MAVRRVGTGSAMNESMAPLRELLEALEVELTNTLRCVGNSSTNHQ